MYFCLKKIKLFERKFTHLIKISFYSKPDIIYTPFRFFLFKAINLIVKIQFKKKGLLNVLLNKNKIR